LITILFKAIFFYSIYVLIRTLFRAYKTVTFVKKSMNQQSSSSSSARTSHKSDDAIEAEYRVVKE